MFNNIVFLIIIFLANIIQGITGFAGTVLAMPPSLFFVDLTVAKPVLNVLGVFSGIYICSIAWKKIDWSVIVRILILMICGMILGFYLVNELREYATIQYRILGSFVFLIGVYNLWITKRGKKLDINRYVLGLILFLAGVFHGMFVCGGPLLVIYLAIKLPEKSVFRATISFVWLILNSIIFFQHYNEGYFIHETTVLSLLAIPLLFAGMVVGNIIHKRISQQFFLNLSYGLLIISGISLLVKN